MKIRPYVATDRAEWLRLRQALWPETDALAHGEEMDHWLARGGTAVLVAERAEGGLAGFAEVGIRSVADGCDTSPVAYLEGWYVDADVRRTGIGGGLIQAAESWARAKGLRELASDAELHNLDSQKAHRALGFSETSRTVLYVKRL